MSPRRIHLPTLIAIAIVAYALANLAHEGLAHGGACVAVGGRPRVLNAVYFDCDKSAASPAGVRWIAAAGSLVNLVLGAVAFGLLARRRPSATAGPGTYFLWLFGTVNWLQATGYWLFSGLGGIGDWARVVEGWEPAVAWRTLLAIAGTIGFAATILYSLRRLAPWLGPAPGRVPAAVRLTVVPYVAGGLLYVAAGLLNPESLVLVLISAAAASFGGTSALAWMAQLLHNERRFPSSPEGGLELPRSNRWMLAGLAAAAIFIGILGPGVHL